jgi:hypothetical protein
MAYGRRSANREFFARIGALIVACTTVLTLSFFGVIALATGGAIGAETRVPLYALGGAVAFVAGVVGFDELRHEGVTILTAASGLAVAVFALLLLGGEGLLYVTRNPEQVVDSRGFLYLIAAGFIATGVGYWGVRHWRSVTSTF